MPRNMTFLELSWATGDDIHGDQSGTVTLLAAVIPCRGKLSVQ
jgi:hypothetical protein